MDMDAQDFLLQHRTPMIGAVVALATGLTGGIALKTGPQDEPFIESVPTYDSQYAEAEPIAWPSGKVPDYVIGTDFLDAQRMDPPPVLVASYEVPEYTAPAWREPEPHVQPARMAEPAERSWASTGGDILNTRLPEDAPPAPEASQAPEPPVATPAPVAMAASSS